MEEDAGKLIHDEWEDCSLVDYNRSGVPLIEIVSEPDMRSADEVIAYLEKLRMIIQYLGASDCKLQEGSMRADVNLSVREVGSEKLGTRTEMKNLNSFKAIAHAIEGERARQIELLEDGEGRSSRRPDDGMIIRNIPMPCVPKRMHRITVISRNRIWCRLSSVMSGWQPSKPVSRSFGRPSWSRYKKDFDIPDYDAQIITSAKKMADLFEATTAICKKPKKVSNWLMVETMRLMKEHEMEAEDLKFSPEHLAKLIDLADAGTINSSVAKEVFEQIFAGRY